MNGGKDIMYFNTFFFYYIYYWTKGWPKYIMANAVSPLLQDV